MPEEKLDDLKASLAQTLGNHGAIELTCERVGCFPQLRFPLVLWTGVHEALGGKVRGAALPVRRDFLRAGEATSNDSSEPNPAGGDALDRLQSEVSAACDHFAEKPDARPFTGHVTLGRFRRLGREDAKPAARVIEAYAGQQFGRWITRAVVLFRSDLFPGRAVHTKLAQFPFRGSPGGP